MAMETIDIYATSNQDMTEEEMAQLAAQIQVERHVAAIDELGIPRFRITNGPVGVGMGDGTQPTRHRAANDHRGGGVLDTEVAREYGDVIGSRPPRWPACAGGSAVNLHRTTIAGRNFEYFSEDPYLSGDGRRDQAIQAHDIIAMASTTSSTTRSTSASAPASSSTSTAARALPAAIRDAGHRRRGRRPHERLQPHRGVYATEYRHTCTTCCATTGASRVTCSPTSGRPGRRQPH